MMRWQLFLRPGILASLVTVLTYYDPIIFHGEFVYDDEAAIVRNPVVRGDVHWTQVVSRDFWGTPLSKPTSHKSFRPITTMSFKLNWMYAERTGKLASTEETVFGFRIVNLALHAIAVFLVTEASALVFHTDTMDNNFARLVTGLLFGLHPVHVEPVSNVTNRAEMLMSICFLLAFLCATRTGMAYSNQSERDWRYRVGTYVLPFLFMVLSTLSKEQGITALASVVIYDLIVTFGSVRNLLRSLLLKKGSFESQEAIDFLKRAAILLSETVVLGAVRLWINGEGSPWFVQDQNPAAFQQDPFARIMSINWVYILYLYDIVYPRHLCPDWSGESIQLISFITDWRVVAVLGLWMAFALCCRGLMFAPTNDVSPVWHFEARRITLISVLAFTMIPFALSSNLIVKVGFMKADRVLYLPLMGFCLLEAMAFQLLFCRSRKPNRFENAAGKDCELKQDERCDKAISDGPKQKGLLKNVGYERKSDDDDAGAMKVIESRGKPNRNSLFGLHWIGHLLLLAQLSIYAGMLRERNLAWRTNFSLWQSAFEVNPRSHHIRHQYGNQLHGKWQHGLAERVLRPIRHPNIFSPDTTFMYCQILMEGRRCDLALPLLDEALTFVRAGESSESGHYMPSQANKKRTESNLLVVKGQCTRDQEERSKILRQALDVDPGNGDASHAWMMRKFQKYAN